MARFVTRIAPSVVALALLASACTSHGAAPSPGSGTATSKHRSASAAPAVLQIRSAPYVLPAPVQRAVAVVDGGTVYIAGGLDSSGASAAGVFAMNASNGKLKSIGSMPNAFHDAAGAMIGGKLVVFGGGSSTGTDVVQAIDVSNGSTSVIGHLPHELSDLGSATIGRTAYLVGGYDGKAPRAEIYSTTDGRRFKVVGTLPAGVRYPAVAAVGTTLVIAGGETTASAATSDVYSFDTASGDVKKLGTLSSPVGHAAAFSLDGTAYVVGGLDRGGHAVADVTSVDPATGAIRQLDPLHRPVSDAAVATTADGALLIGGWRGSTVADVLAASLRAPHGAGQRPSPTVTPSVGTAPSPTASASAAGADVRPFAGLLLVADRGNDRLLVLNANKHIVWRYPSKDLPAPPFPFYFPDDAFWVHGGNAILVNEEENDVLAEIAYPSGKTLWTYGHPRTPGSSPGYVHQPDDLYPYPGGGLVVADASNCRILFLGPAGRPTGQIGQTGNCTPGLPASVGYPNGDTPLPNGHLLVSELHGGTIGEVTPTGHPVWITHVPGITVPSDPQRLADGTYLAVNYANPGAVERFTSTGKVLWRYHPTKGKGALDHPSLAIPLPNGLVAVNDDYNHRVVIIDPKNDRIVWQYGVNGVSGSSSGHLSYPDGMDLMLPGNVIPLHIDFASSEVHAGRP